GFVTTGGKCCSEGLHPDQLSYWMGAKIGGQRGKSVWPAISGPPDTTWSFPPAKNKAKLLPESSLIRHDLPMTSSLVSSYSPQRCHYHSGAVRRSHRETLCDSHSRRQAVENPGNTEGTPNRY